ncbi:unnamed protein product, partial [marine sediment metagenome]
KSNAINTLKELISRKAQGVLAIVDSDYWILEGYQPLENLLFTDTHDVETLILLSPALERVLRELVPGDSMNTIDQIGNKVRELVVSVGIPLGIFRWVCFRDGFELNFQILPYERFVQGDPPTLNKSGMIETVKTSSKVISDPDAILLEKINQLEKSKADPWLVCQGHDLVHLLEIVIPYVLQKVLGREVAKNTEKRCQADHLSRELRLAYRPEYFQNTELYASIRIWEENNSPHKVLLS